MCLSSLNHTSLNQHSVCCCQRLFAADSLKVFPRGMHDIIGTLSVSGDIGIQINYWILAGTTICADIITHKIIGYFFID